MEKQTDEELIKAAKKGQNSALDTLVARYLLLVYNFSFRYVSSSDDAEDIAQETFVKVWRHLSHFDSSKPFKPWLYRIAKNTCLDFLKKKSAIPFSYFESEAGNALSDSLADQGRSPQEEADQAILASSLSSLVGRLSPKLSETLQLHHGSQLNFREISERQGESLNTVKSRYRRALGQLKKLFESL